MRTFAVVSLVACVIALASCNGLPFGHLPVNGLPFGAVMPPTLSSDSGADPSCSDGYCYYFGMTAMSPQNGDAVGFCSSNMFRFYNSPNGTMSSTIVCQDDDPVTATLSFQNIDSDDWTASISLDTGGSLDLKNSPGFYYSQVGTSNIYVTAYAAVYPEQSCTRLCTGN